MHNLTTNVITLRVANAQAAAQTPVNSAWVDTQGALGVRFIAALGALSAGQVTSAKLQYSDDGATNPLDVAGTSTGPAADADSNKQFIIELFKPQQRYVRMVVSRATQNAGVDAITAEVFLPNRLPVVQDASVSAYKVLNSAVAGAA